MPLAAFAGGADGAEGEGVAEEVESGWGEVENFAGLDGPLEEGGEGFGGEGVTGFYAGVVAVAGCVSQEWGADVVGTGDDLDGFFGFDQPVQD